MSETVGDFLVERLHSWGVRVLFGYPGDGINGVFGALNRAKHKIRFVQARHEEMAAFMASAYAKFTGELGVCIATSGPGASQVTWEQRVMEGDPKFEASQAIPNVPYHRFAELIGLEGIFVDRPDALGPAWDQALAARRPVVLEVKTDPEVPPLPPHITFEQAVKFSKALLKGDPREAAVIKGTARQVLS
jgi:thiamine pyrophosphate-dependent acetolactate synthase large subunit-like protein